MSLLQVCLAGAGLGGIVDRQFLHPVSTIGAYREGSSRVAAVRTVGPRRHLAIRSRSEDLVALLQHNSYDLMFPGSSCGWLGRSPASEFSSYRPGASEQANQVSV